VDKSTLPVTDPWAVLPDAPADPDISAMPTGKLVAPVDPAGAVLWDAPEGKPFAILPVESYIGKSAYPVIAETRQSYQVLIGARRGLPSEIGGPNVNGATGWVLKTDVTTSSTDYAIVVDLSDQTTTLYQGGQEIFATSAAVGKPASPTPVTRTYIMSIYSDPTVRYTPYYVALATHSDTLDAFRGGPAPTAIHTDVATAGPISNGCVRVPPDALGHFKDLPLGTPVVIQP
jgi:lipoprotein-anchoring transpeptidase ErfK/SrfK